MCYHIASTTRLITAAVIFLLAAGLPVSAQETDETGQEQEHRFEFSIIGGSGAVQDQPDWISSAYLSVGASLTLNLPMGISVQGGRTFASGNEIGHEWRTYGPHFQILTDGGTGNEENWFGLRYQLVLDTIKRKFLAAHAVQVGAGISRGTLTLNTIEDHFYQNASGWERDEEPDIDRNENTFTAADLSGWYVMTALRWRFDKLGLRASDMGLGQYGVDLGVKYTRYSDIDRKYDTIAAADPFGELRLFLAVFLKIGLLD